MVTLSINQPAYLPRLAYFDRIIKSDIHVVLDHVKFENGGFTNRNKILTNHGPLMLTIPVKGRGSDTPICEMEVAPGPWRKKHWDTIRQSYVRSPYRARMEHFGCLYHTLPNALLGTELSDFTYPFLMFWEIKTPIHRSSMTFNCAALGKKSDLVLNICKEMGATTYLSGPQGPNYLNMKDFEDAGIEVKIHEYKETPYPQTQPGFVPNLSAIDALLNTKDFPHG